MRGGAAARGPYDRHEELPIDAQRSSAPTATERFLAEVRRFAAGADVHRLFPALEAHEPEPDQLGRLLSGIQVAEEMAARLAGVAADFAGASCLLLDADTVPIIVRIADIFFQFSA